jgi:formylglycine-generating enzyme required for sulfatase activity/cytochrome c553
MNKFKQLLLLVPLTACSSQLSTAADEFRDCPECPVMIPVPAGSFLMGTAEADRLTDPRTGKPATNDGPQHQVDIREPFDIGKYEVTVAEFRRFIEATGYEPIEKCMGFSKEESFKISADITWDKPDFDQYDNAPVGCVSFFDAEAYSEWLSTISGEAYRLPTEAEWEYAARAGSSSSYYWGNDEAAACDYANVRSPGAFSISKRQAESDMNDGFPCDDKAGQSAPAGSYKANAFGLHDMQGNNWEWVADCSHKSYADAPTDGRAWLDEKTCRFGVIRGGSYLNRVERSSATVRAGRPRSGGATNMGFRVARGTLANQVTANKSTPMIYEALADISPGALLFADHCAACHQSPYGFEGLYGTDQQSLVKAIRDGGNNIMSMPAFSDRLSDEQIELVAAYLRKINKWN